MIKNLILWLLMSIIITSLFQGYMIIKNDYNKMDYSTFISELNKNYIKEVNFNKNEINIIKKNNKHYIVYTPMNDSKLLNILLNKNIKISGSPSGELNLLTSIFISWFPMLLLIGVWIFFIRQIHGVNKGAMNFGKSRARMFTKNQLKITFADIAGCDEAKEEVSELVDFLKEPSRFTKLGGKIPTGILMIGPPGTGKTMLAKAIACEAKVPFFTISGSDFVEMFVGVGASRMRNMFKQAKKKSPCIIFIDEIDAVGRNRGSSFGGGNDEREQTLNQMLVEMDGFNGKEGVIVIAATNRSDVLDPALLRPGRFDRQVIVNLPDILGRDQILKIHIKKIPLNKDVNTLTIARSTPGFSGADLANLINEATLFAARINKKVVSMIDFEKAKDKIIMGSERKSMIMNEEQKEHTAYHEAGHAIVGYLVPEHDPIHKITIIPRGQALGATLFLPEKDYLNSTKQKLESQISALYGGRLAEKIIYGKNKISTGAFNDIKIATSIARNMITQWGFSEKLAPLLYNDENKELTFNNSINKIKYISDKTSYIVDLEIKFIINRNYKRSHLLLIKNIDILHNIKDNLIKYETINKNQIKDLMNRIIKI